MASLIIGVMGKKRHGKDTFASRLISAHGFARLAFADPMRDGLYGLNPLIRVEGDEVGPLLEAGCYVSPGDHVRLRYLVDSVGWEKAKEVREVRRLLQEYGTGLRETLGENVWVDATLRQAAAIDGPVVITDVRFPNEVTAVVGDDDLKGFTVRVTRPSIPDSGDKHISETALDGIRADFEVTNSSTLDDLYRQADAVLARVRA